MYSPVFWFNFLKFFLILFLALACNIYYVFWHFQAIQSISIMVRTYVARSINFFNDKTFFLFYPKNAINIYLSLNVIV